MNRETKRKMAKQMGIPVKELEKYLTPEVVNINLEDLPDGERVRLKTNRILEHSSDYSEDYIKFVNDNNGKIFTVKKYNNGVGKDNSKRFTLNEDENEIKWIFHLDDLELVLDI